ncbi:pectate lyase [Trifolium repens]|nr:pectate lyase [Trifolium repens]
MQPYGDVDSTLRAIAGRAEGFGRLAIGGLHDDGPGTLREGCRRKEPLWIVFEVSGTIHLSSYLSVSSHKTIDGRGQRIKLTGKEYLDRRCSLRDYDDGLIDITRQSTDITISRCYFAQHDKTMLIGADPTHVGDRCIRVTIHHCFFDGTNQRHPRVRFGKVHLYNNYTRNWTVYAICASVESQIYSQCNIYEAGDKKKAYEFYTEKAADKEEPKSGIIISEGDLVLNGAQPCLPTEYKESVFHPSEYYPTWTMEAATHSLREIIQLCTGWQSLCRPVDNMVMN